MSNEANRVRELRYALDQTAGAPLPMAGPASKQETIGALRSAITYDLFEVGVVVDPEEVVPGVLISVWDQASGVSAVIGMSRDEAAVARGLLDGAIEAIDSTNTDERTQP